VRWVDCDFRARARPTLEESTKSLGELVRASPPVGNKIGHHHGSEGEKKIMLDVVAQPLATSCRHT